MRTDNYYLVDELDALLEKERAAILAGDLKGMGRISRNKEKLLNSYELIAPNMESLEYLRKKVTRNQTLLAAAIRGVRAVTTRLGALQNGQSKLNTYNKAGKRSVLGSGIGGTLQHKA